MTAILRPLLLLGLMAVPCTGLAHRLDEYLQATLVNIEPDQVRLQINLTPGVAVAGRVLARIDRDHDGLISTNEAAAYAESIKNQLNLMVDHQKIPLNVSACNFPPLKELRTGWGIIQLEFAAIIGPLSTGAHTVTLRNRHLPSLSVYLFNAVQPRSPVVRITRQTRSKTQSTGEIDFVITQPKS